jgi:hypothetical protein
VSFIFVVKRILFISLHPAIPARPALPLFFILDLPVAVLCRTLRGPIQLPQAPTRLPQASKLDPIDLAVE